MSGGGITLGGGGSGGVVAGGVWFPTESGLQAPGGLFDRLTQAMDARSQYEGTLRGYGPALRDAGVPVPAASPSILSQVLGTVGLSPTQPVPMPNSSAPISGGGGASMPSAQPSSAGGPGPITGPISGNALASYIGQGAQKRGIDPMTALRVVQSEGGFAPATAGDSGSSFGPFQLHYASGTSGPNASPGMGDDFTRATGLDARDPRNATAAIDFALDRAAKEGWGAFHGAARAGIGQWDGIGGAPTQTMSYAPADSSGRASLRPPTAAGQDGADPMPIATAGLGVPQTPQSAMPRSPVSGGAGGASAQGNPTSPGAVLGPLMANPQTRPIGARMWQGMMQGGGAQGGLTLPGGMTPADLAAMIAEPATMQTGLAIWQKSLYPQISAYGPNQSIFAGGRFVGTTPSAPMDVAQGNSVVDPNSGRIIARTAPAPVKLSPGESLVPPQGGAPIASVPPALHFTDAQSRVIASDPRSGASADVTPAGVPTQADLKAREGMDANILDNVDKSRGQAIASVRALDAINRQQTALDKGTYTGGTADTRLKLMNALGGLLGIPVPGVEHTQEFIAAANSKAAEIAKQLSNSGHTTNADLNMAKVIGGGDINYSLSTLREIGRAQQQLQLDTIKRHNALVDEGSKWNSALAKGQDFYKVPVPQNTYDFARSAAFSNARAALARGADRDAVAKRLQGAGYDPGQL